MCSLHFSAVAEHVGLLSPWNPEARHGHATLKSRFQQVLAWFEIDYSKACTDLKKHVSRPQVIGFWTVAH